MMKKKYFFLLIMPIFSLSQIKPKIVYNDAQRMNLKGDVKEFFEVDYRVENNIITETKKKDFCQFLINGRLQTKVNFVNETVTNFIYDNRDRILSEKSKSNNNELELHYSYPEDSVVVITAKEGNYISISRNIIKKDFELEIKKNSNVTQYIENYTYDKLSRIIKSQGLQYYPNKVDTLKITSVYHKKCLMPILQSFKKPFFRNILNDNCDIITHIVLKNDGTSEQSQYTYIYDKEKNWIERKTYLGGILLKSTKREIKYY